jgi:hypothetical protein
MSTPMHMELQDNGRGEDFQMGDWNCVFGAKLVSNTMKQFAKSILSHQFRTLASLLEFLFFRRTVLETMTELGTKTTSSSTESTV